MDQASLPFALSLEMPAFDMQSDRAIFYVGFSDKFERDSWVAALQQGAKYRETKERTEREDAEAYQDRIR